MGQGSQVITINDYAHSSPVNTLSCTMLSFRSFVLILFISLKECSLQPQCPMFPKGHKDKSLNIDILGNPNVFIPSSAYTVKLGSSFEFDKFIITLEGDNGGGNLQIINSRDATFAEECLGTIIQTSKKPKSEIQFIWTSPKSGCSTINGAVLKHNQWLVNSNTICSNEQQTEEKVQECCSCDHARYKVVFEGLWSPETHPKDFPTLLWLTHFSDVIGATHTPNFTMWSEGGLASYGLKQLAEYGIVREMENELRLESTKLRSIVKAAGLWHPNLNEKTTAVLRVDPRRHLLSLASMFGPSPDWIVGISAFNLCLENCTWLVNKVIDLYPYDAGTDSGRTYMSLKTATDPPERIRRITTKFPDDPRSPFYNSEINDMPPLARLFIERDQVIPKLCSDLTEQELLQQVTESENTEDENRPECAVTEYSSWSECSVTCGKGLRMRSRTYLAPKKAKQSNCDRQLVSKEMCTAAEEACPGEEGEEDIIPLVGPGECEVTDWTEWSECSVTCGIGAKIRSRTFLSSEPNVIKKCMHISTSEMEKCMLPQCHLNEKKVSRACSVSEWSIWSPCSVTCGQGIASRVRKFLSPNPHLSCTHQVKLTQQLNCSAPACKFDHTYSEEICALKSTYGPCRGNFTRWAYDQKQGKCVTFLYGGCRGNKNNFLNEDDCKATCLAELQKQPDVHVQSKHQNENVENADNGLENKLQNNLNHHLNKNSEKVINCVVSRWSSWSFCTPCVNGTKTKTRTIIKEPKNGGKPCPNLAVTIKCSLPSSFCKAIDGYYYN